MLELEWKIVQLDTKPLENNLNDVVVAIHWFCLGTEDIYIGREFGVVDLESPTENFTPYNDLTEEQIWEWVWNSGVNKLEVEAKVTQLIEDLKNPPIVNLPLPWER